MENLTITKSEFGQHLLEKYYVEVSVTLRKTIGVRAIDKEEAAILAANRTLNKTKAYERSGHDVCNVSAETVTRQMTNAKQDK